MAIEKYIIFFTMQQFRFIIMLNINFQICDETLAVKAIKHMEPD